MKPRGRFHFPLETVLKVRLLREDQAKQELARARNQLARSRQALSETESHFARTLGYISDAPQKVWDAPHYLMSWRFLEHLKLAVEGWRERVAQEEAGVAEHVLTLQRRHQERRVLERLRERKFAEFRRDLTKFLENETEAIILARWPHS